MDTSEAQYAERSSFFYYQLYGFMVPINRQANTQVLQQRVETLERELDAAITAATQVRSEKRHAETAQKAAELRSQEVAKENLRTLLVFKLHMAELRVKQEEITKRDNDIKLLEAIIQTFGGKVSGTSKGSRSD